MDSCLCHVKCEVYLGTAADMLSRYGSAVASGNCRHFDPSDEDETEEDFNGFDHYEIFDYVEGNLNETEGGLNALQVR